MFSEGFLECFNILLWTTTVLHQAENESEELSKNYYRAFIFVAAIVGPLSRVKPQKYLEIFERVEDFSHGVMAYTSLQWCCWHIFGMFTQKKLNDGLYALTFLIPIVLSQSASLLKSIQNHFVRRENESVEESDILDSQSRYIKPITFQDRMVYFLFSLAAWYKLLGLPVEGEVAVDENQGINLSKSDYGVYWHVGLAFFPAILTTSIFHRSIEEWNLFSRAVMFIAMLGTFGINVYKESVDPVYWVGVVCGALMIGGLTRYFVQQNEKAILDSQRPAPSKEEADLRRMLTHGFPAGIYDSSDTSRGSEVQMGRPSGTLL